MEIYIPTHKVTANYHTGMSLLNRHQYDHAFDTLSNEPLESPCFTLAYGYSALALLRMGKYREAEATMMGALTAIDYWGCPHAPSHIQFLRTLGEAVASQGRFAESFGIFNAAGNLGRELAKKVPSDSAAIDLEVAHAFNSWGTSHLKLRRYEVAVDLFDAARQIYRKHPDPNVPGRAEVLTNLAHAYRKLKQKTKAEFALQEALDFANSRGDADQIMRVKMALIQLGADSIERGEAYRIIARGTEDAENAGRLADAYVRLCIGAEYARKQGDVEKGLEFVRSARAKEGSLDRNDPHATMLWTTEAQLLMASGATTAEVVRALLSGAKQWYLRLTRVSDPGDQSATIDSFHDHFRLLARSLVNDGRLDEALAAFEAGRALSHALEVDPNQIVMLRDAEFFDTEAGEVRSTLLRRIRRNLPSGKVGISIAFLPPDISIFLVDADTVEHTSVPIPSSSIEADELLNGLRTIPERLANNGGHAAIPAIINAVAEATHRCLGGRTIGSFAPYGLLHNVPWRELLAHAGVARHQLRFSIRYSLLFDRHPRIQAVPATCVALASGGAGDGTTRIDFAEEARHFSVAFKEGGKLVVDCRAQDVTSALCANAVVLISSHGNSIDSDAGVELVLHLEDGIKPVGEVFPAVVSSPVVLLSACESAVYQMGWGDFPVGAAPQLLRQGARVVVGTRYEIRATFARDFMPRLGSKLACGTPAVEAFNDTLAEVEATWDRWRDLACVECFE